MKERKPKGPVKPKLLTLEQWAEPKFKKKTSMTVKKNQTLTEFVRELCLELGQENPDQITLEPAPYTYEKPTAISIKITPEIQTAYNTYVLSHEKRLEDYERELAQYNSKLDIWKQTMINQIKGMK